jgi:pimeloyl-ACP methyl ester carboxylesterase
MPLAHRVLSKAYRMPATPFDVRTDDGLTLRGARLGVGPAALVFCHGFAGWHRKRSLVPFQEALAESFTVYAFDFRGHGRSEGRSTYGADEHRDVDAVVRLARAEGARRVVTMGGSMGGIAVVRHAALLGGVDAVVAISTPARWQGHTTRAVRRLVWLTSTRAGRTALRAAGMRPARRWTPVEGPIEVVADIAPIPLVLVHGHDDEFFESDDAWALYRAAGEPKRLLLATRFGHAESGYSTEFAGRITRAIEASIGSRRPVEVH